MSNNKKIKDFSNKSVPDVTDAFLLQAADGTYYYVTQLQLAGSITAGYLTYLSDTAAGWTSNNPILPDGSIGIESDTMLTSPKFKIAFSSNHWNDLPYANVSLSGLTTNTIPKATASDTIGDSSITDDGTTVTVNSPTVITSDNSNNQIISIDNLKALVAHDVKILFNSPIYSFANMQANETVETDASKNLVSVAKATGYNLALGTTAGTVLEGNRITQTITNGVTDKVPSEDAVFDALALKLTQNNFTDITGSCTMPGWISFSVNKIKAIDMGSYYIVNGQVVGTSNSSTTQVVLPFTNNGVQLDDCRFAINNGTYIFARCFVGAGSNTVDFRATAAGSTFSSNGTKAIYFTIVVEK